MIRNEQGYFFHRGIAKNMVVCGGENVFPESVEMVINQHPDVAASKVFGVPDSDFGSVLNAIVELRDDAILTEEDLMVWLKPKLSRAEMPHRIEFKKLEVLSTGKRANLKAVAILMAVALMIGCGIGGTLAWLKDNTNTITNTFTGSNLKITLSETVPQNKTAKMVPGAIIKKDPTITVKKGSEDCYVFVKIEESSDLKKFIEYSVAEGWIEVTSGSGVYYRTVEYNNDEDQKFQILNSDQVTVKASVTKEDMTDIAAQTLSFTAYAIQSQNINVSEISQIWELAQGNVAV